MLTEVSFSLSHLHDPDFQTTSPWPHTRQMTEDDNPAISCSSMDEKRGTVGVKKRVHAGSQLDGRATRTVQSVVKVL